MRLVVDLHVHGRFSVATSRDLSLASLHEAAARKGVDVVGTGDIVHPGWRKEAAEVLCEEHGLFVLRHPPPESRPLAAARMVRFALTGEISTIYSDGDRVRKVHHLVLVPSFESAEALAWSLARIGSIESDGRPVLGLRSRDLLEIVLSCDPRAVLIPAHIWTPWFSALGSRSGYDSIEACYDDLASHIVAIETGLSSDPAMNWRLSSLDRFAIVSSSDAHSADKVGREATVLRCEPTFEGIAGALRQGGEGIEATIEFFPEEGKYHLDGHRACGVRLEPEQTRRVGGKCPRCGGALTVGVLHRVGELADRPPGFRPNSRPGFTRLVPLAEVLGQALGVAASSRAVQAAYAHTLRALGPELSVLMEVPLDDLERICGDRVAEAISNMREGRVVTEPGYDGQYGTIRLLGQAPPRAPRRQAAASQLDLPSAEVTLARGLSGEAHLNAGRHLVVVAGPGSGKTSLLTQRMAQVLASGQGPVRGVTFTRAAAQELHERLRAKIGSCDSLWTGTLHQLAYELVGRAGREVTLLDDRQRAVLLRWRLAHRGYMVSEAGALRLVHRVSALRHGTATTPAPTFGDGMLRELYAQVKEESGALDYDDLIELATEVVRRSGTGEAAHLFVDEFQDLDRAQYEFVRALAVGALSVMAIGDPYQSIYGFRGGDPCLVTRFVGDHPGCEVRTLAQSYRCGQAILEAADAVVDRSPPMQSATGRPGVVELLRASSVHREARMVAGRIEELLGGTTLERAQDQELSVRGFGDIAVLVRTGTMAGVFARALGEAGIPCRVVRTTALSEDRAVSRVLAWLRLALDPTSVADLLVVRGWGGGPGSIEPLRETEAEELRAIGRCAPVEALASASVRHGSSAVDPARMDALQRLAAASRDLADFVTRVAAEREAGVVDSRAEAVRVMTMHAAKGLEFGAVFVTGFRDGLIPLAGADPAEEARVCYVAMTRARSYLALTYAGQASHVSRFARTLPPRVLASQRRTRPRAVQLELEWG